MDIDYDRKIATNLREYVGEAKRMKEMFIWIWQEFTNKKSKKYAKKMFWVMLIRNFCNVSIWPAIGVAFNGLVIRDLGQIQIGSALFIGILTIKTLVGHFGMTYRELLLGENLFMLDQKSTSLFFEKSLGTHISADNLLNEANVKKGYERFNQLKDMILFEGVESLQLLMLTIMAMLVIDWKISIMVVLLLVIYLGWSLFLNQKTLEVCIPLDIKWRSYNRYRVERWNMVERVKTNNKEEDELKEMTRQFYEIIKPDRKFWLWFIGQLTKRGIVKSIFCVVIIVYAIYETWHGHMSIGVIVPLTSWTIQLTDNLWQIGHIEHQVNFLTPPILAMKEALSLPIGLKEAKNPIKLSHNNTCRVEFINVSHSYEEVLPQSGGRAARVPVLDNISFTVEAGEKVAIVGESGAGKTTIKNLLMRYMDPSAGKILINGIDLTEIKIGSWLEQVGYVPQFHQIMDGTIHYNLLYGLRDKGKNKVDDKQIAEIVNRLQIDFGDRLVHGLNTEVGRNGIKLSGGQAQRVMIGSAVSKNPNFMIIDEATSSLDATTEKLVQAGMKKILTKNLGAIIITHRLNTVRRICDKFIMLSGNGQGSQIMAMANSFEELARLAPDFKRLARDQDIIL
ncbi:ABC transporter ATP-binding protein/permease [bacterium]|nr:ABC transporter ATP-binding protein/permease [bacterium]